MSALGRREMLFGAGGGVMALPWLELNAAAATQEIAPRRFAAFYSPMGFVRDHFFPDPGAIDFLSKPTLSPLRKLREKVSLITGLYRVNVRGTDVHNQASSCYLSSQDPQGELKSPYPMDRTLDHLIADQVGHRTPIRSLELNCNSFKDLKESIYLDNISWYGPEHVATSMKDPRQVYRRLFQTRSSDKDITDLVLEDAKQFKQSLNQHDRHKLDEYFESVREIEKQINRLNHYYETHAAIQMKEPEQGPMTRGEYIRLMCKLLVVAFQSNLTHVSTFMLAPERWGSPQHFHELNFTKSHHGLTHGQSNETAKNFLVQVDHFYLSLFAEFLEQMDSVDEGEGTLLDHSIVTLGSGLGDGEHHTMNELPIVMAGSANGRLKTGELFECATETPLANLWLLQAQLMGAGLNRFADSTEPLDSLLV